MSTNYGNGSFRSYRDRIRDAGIGNASYNGDPFAQAYRSLIGHKASLESHEQWMRESEGRFARDADNMKRIADLRSANLTNEQQAITLDTLRRTQSSAIERANAENEAEALKNKHARIVAEQLLKDETMRQERSASIRKGANFAILDQLFRDGKVSKSLLAQANAARAEEYGDDYDPATDDVADVFRDGDDVIMVRYKNGETLPWQDMRTVLDYGEAFDIDVSSFLPASYRTQHNLNLARKQERELAESAANRQYANAELSALKSELDARMKLRTAAEGAGKDTKDQDGAINAILDRMKQIRDSLGGLAPTPTAETPGSASSALAAGNATTQAIKQNANVFDPTK